MGIGAVNLRHELNKMAEENKKPFKWDEAKFNGLVEELKASGDIKMSNEVLQICGLLSNDENVNPEDVKSLYNKALETLDGNKTKLADFLTKLSTTVKGNKDNKNFSLNTGDIETLLAKYQECASIKAGATASQTLFLSAAASYIQDKNKPTFDDASADNKSKLESSVDDLRNQYLEMLGKSSVKYNKDIDKQTDIDAEIEKIKDNIDKVNDVFDTGAEVTPPEIDIDKIKDIIADVNDKIENDNIFGIGMETVTPNILTREQLDEFKEKTINEVVTLFESGSLNDAKEKLDILNVKYDFQQDAQSHATLKFEVGGETYNIEFKMDSAEYEVQKLAPNQDDKVDILEDKGAANHYDIGGPDMMADRLLNWRGRLLH